MSAQDAGNCSQEYCELDEREEKSILPWLDESEITAREYGEDDPWINEG